MSKPAWTVGCRQGRSLNTRVIFYGIGVCWLLWWEGAGVSGFPCLVRSVSGLGEVRYSLGDRLVDRYLEFVGWSGGGDGWVIGQSTAVFKAMANAAEDRLTDRRMG